MSWPQEIHFKNCILLSPCGHIILLHTTTYWNGTLNQQLQLSSLGKLTTSPNVPPNVTHLHVFCLFECSVCSVCRVCSVCSTWVWSVGRAVTRRDSGLIQEGTSTPSSHHGPPLQLCPSCPCCLEVGRKYTFGHSSKTHDWYFKIWSIHT